MLPPSLNFWVSKTLPLRFLFPSDLQSHYQALLANNQEMKDWLQCSWRAGRGLNILPSFGEFHEETGQPLDRFMEVQILEKWPTIDDFTTLIKSEADKVLSNLKDEELYIAGCIFPADVAVLKKHITRLNGTFLARAKKDWKLVA